MNLNGHDSQSFVNELVARYREGLNTRATWLNHHSWLMDVEAGLDLQGVDMVGIDGQLLSKILGREASSRSSADVAIPLFLDLVGSGNIAILGSTSENLIRTAKAIEKRWPRWKVVWVRDGYDGKPSLHWIRDRIPDVDILIIGLGAPEQDQYLTQFVGHGQGPRVVLTCGGWIDQFSTPGYYPTWAYQLRLTWLIRLAREPRRLWRRYTLTAIEVLARRKECIRYHDLLNVRPDPREGVLRRMVRRVDGGNQIVDALAVKSKGRHMCEDTRSTSPRPSS